MEIWDILGIAPTTDKKRIKRAYAARSREIHPEEKPDEFRMLYSAYQAALRYAKVKAEQAGSTDEGIPGSEKSVQGQKADMDDLPKEKEAEKEEELRSYFEMQERERKEKIAFFREKWEKLRFEHMQPEVQKWWEGYLGSKDFQEIRWHPELLKLLGEEMDKQLPYDYIIRFFFWEAYGFQKEEHVSQDDVRELRRKLYPAYKWKKQREVKKRQEEERRRAYEKQQRLYEKWTKAVRRFVIGAFVLGCTALFIGGRQRLAAEQRFVETYMREKYPETEFSRPKKAGSYYGACYEMYPLSHPDILVSVEFYYDNDDEIYGESEDYGLQLLAYYAGQYGLECRSKEEGGYIWSYQLEEDISVLYYQDTENLGGFCDAVVRMFREQEELQELAAVGICKENALYPNAFVNGGVEEFHPAEGQFYRPWEMEASVLEERIREGYMEYMFHFEAWNLTPEQYLEWGPAYEEICRSVEEDHDSGMWCDIYREGTDGPACKIYIPTYIHIMYGTVEYMDGTNYKTEMIFSGDAYHYLMAEGACVTAAEDGSGFSVKNGGKESFYGEEPAIERELLQEQIS